MKEFRLAVRILSKEGEKLRLNVEFPVVIDVPHDVDGCARQDDERLFDIDVDGLCFAVRILDENPAGERERPVEPAMEDEPSVGFQCQTLDAAVDFGGHRFDPKAGRILMRRADAKSGLARISHDSEGCALGAFLCEIIGFPLFDLPGVAFVQAHGAGAVQHGAKRVGRLKGRRRIAQKL